MEWQRRILGLLGSPFHGGDSELLLREAIRGAEVEGATSTILRIADLGVAPCPECVGCYETGSCIVEDGYQTVAAELRTTDALIFASPVYFGGVTAQAKALIDRTQSFWIEKYKLKRRWRASEERPRALFVSTAGSSRAGQFDGALKEARAFFAATDFEFAGSLLFGGLDERGSIRSHPTALRDAFEAGRALFAPSPTPARGSED